MYCSGCQSYLGLFARAKAWLCDACFEELSASSEAAFAPITSFLDHRSSTKGQLDSILCYGALPYTAIIRTLIQEAKARSNEMALAGILRLWSEDKAAAELAGWADLILPAPPSLWSRWQLKFDLAALLARELAAKKTTAAMLINPPLSLSWQKRKKQSFSGKKRKLSDRQSRRRRDIVESLLHQHRQAASKRRLKVLLIDDVVTTGSTLQSLLPRSDLYDLRIAVLAYRDRDDKNDVPLN